MHCVGRHQLVSVLFSASLLNSVFDDRTLSFHPSTPAGQFAIQQTLKNES